MRGGGFPRGGAEQREEGCTGIGLTHEGFADEAGVESGSAEAAERRGGVDTAFGDVDGVGWELGGEVQ